MPAVMSTAKAPVVSVQATRISTRRSNRVNRSLRIRAQEGGGESEGSSSQQAQESGEQEGQNQGAAPAKKERSKDSIALGGVGTSTEALAYLDGTMAGDAGFDPLELANPEGSGGVVTPSWLRYAEVIHCRWAMLGAVGCIAPEGLGKLGVIPQKTAVEWFRSGVIPPAGTYDYWADPYALFWIEMVLMGFAEIRRLQDYRKPGSMGKEPFFGLQKDFAGTGDPCYPGGLFNPLNLGKKNPQNARTAEVRNGRLAMIAMLGFFLQAAFTNKGPVQNLIDHVSSFGKVNFFTNLQTTLLQ